MKRILVMVFVTALCSLALAQQPAQPSTSGAQAAPQGPPTVTRILHNQLRGVESEFVPAAEAMPDDKFNFAPTQGEFKGVRTFAQQVKHVAATQYLVAAAISGQAVPASAGTDENGPANLTSKADIVKYIKDSFAFAHQALDSVNAENAAGMIKSPFGPGQTTRLGMATLLVSHAFDHYGQMAVYLRMNSIVPPASRGQ